MPLKVLLLLLFLLLLLLLLLLSEILEKQHFSTASVACGCFCLRLLQLNSFEQLTSRGKTPCF